jgi:hypothetical protein
MMGWQEGTFYIKHGPVTDEVNIVIDTMHLLLEGATIMDEKQAGIATRAEKEVPDQVGRHHANN